MICEFQLTMLVFWLDTAARSRILVLFVPCGVLGGIAARSELSDYPLLLFLRLYGVHGDSQLRILRIINLDASHWV